MSDEAHSGSDAELEAAWWEEGEPDEEVEPEPLAQPQWQDINPPAGDQDVERAPGMAPADFGDGLFEEDT